MSSIAHCQKSEFAPARGKAVGATAWPVRMLDVLNRVVDFLERAAMGRRALRQLAEADDRMLKDIGLDRSDLRNASAGPLFRDPTELLAGRVRESRTHTPHRLDVTPAPHRLDMMSELTRRLPASRYY